MKHCIFTLLLLVFVYENSNSQTTDSISADSLLINSELNFTDSISNLNEKNKLLSRSRNAYNKGLEFVLNNDFEQAINSFTNAITIDSAFSSAYFERANCYGGPNDELAISDYSTAFLLDSSN